MPSSCGIFVYSDRTSSVTSVAFGGIIVFMSSIVSRKSSVCLMYEGRFCTIGFR